MLTLLIRNFIISLEDQEDANDFLDKIEKEINEKELHSYCSKLREHLASDSYPYKGGAHVPHGTDTPSENERRSNENNGDV